MDRRITIAVVAVLVLLGGYIWYTFLRADAPPLTQATPEPTAILFLETPQDQVQAVQVQEAKAGKTTRVVRDGDIWKMEQPAQGQADFSRADDLVFTLAHVNAERKIAAPSDLTPFGLNPPQYEVKLELKNSTALRLHLGNKNPEGSLFYITKEGDTSVYLIDASIGEDIQNFVTTPPYTPTPSATPPPSVTPEATPTR